MTTTPDDIEKPLFDKLRQALSDSKVKFNYEILDYFNSTESVRFAYSALRIPGQKVEAYREFKRIGGNPWETSRVFVNFFNKDGLQRYQIPQGEDPRTFCFRNNIWVYYQVFVPEKRDLDIFIFCPALNLTHQLESPFGFNGKNWVPFEFNEKLFFIYSLEPLQVIYLDEIMNGKIVLKNFLSDLSFIAKWDVDLSNSFGRVRGGSRLIVKNKINFGFSHSVNNLKDYSLHTLGLYSISKTLDSFKYLQLSNIVDGFLIDPYGIELKGRSVHLYCSIGNKDIHHDNSEVANIVLKTSLRKIYKALQSIA